MNTWLAYGLIGTLTFMMVGCATQDVKPKVEDAAALKLVNDEAAENALKASAKLSINDVLDSAMFKANAAYQANQSDKAIAVLKEVAVAYPANKAPWLRMAQASFDAGGYSDAIANAQEALRRDPKDRLANSIVVVSGLRLATKSLAGLRSQNEISGSLRTEAQDLAKILRESLGESSLVNGSNITTHKKLKSQIGTQSPPAIASDKTGVTKNSDTGNPFEVLK